MIANWLMLSKHSPKLQDVWYLTVLSSSSIQFWFLQPSYLRVTICLISCEVLWSKFFLCCLTHSGHMSSLSYHLRFCCPNDSSLFTYLLTPWCRVLLQKLTGLQLVKKFPAFHGTRRFITALTSVRHLFLSWASSIRGHTPTSHFLKIHLNIILPSTPRSPQWPLTLSFPH